LGEKEQNAITNKSTHKDERSSTGDSGENQSSKNFEPARGTA
jgi:hypothetical protein